MFHIRRSVTTFLMVVVFLVLATIASINYSGNEADQEKLAENVWYQKARTYLGAVLAGASLLADVNLDKNLGYGQKIKDELKTVDLQKISLGTFTNVTKTDQDKEPTTDEVNSSEADNESSLDQEFIPEKKTGFWSGLGDKLKNEWQKNDPDETGPDFKEVFSYQKTATGVDLILKLKKDGEYKFSLPFKFLGNK